MSPLEDFPLRFSKLKSHLALEGNIVPVLLLIILVVTGEKIWERFLPKYLEEIGASVMIIGSLGFLQNIFAAGWALHGGFASDRLGYRNAFQYFSILAVAGYVIAILFTHWIAVFIGMVFFSAWGNVSQPATMALIVKTVGQQKAAMGLSMHSIIRRIPKAIGPLLGAMLITWFGMEAGIKWAFAIAAILCVGALFLIRKMPNTQDSYEKMSLKQLWTLMDSRLKGLLFSDILIRFCEQIPFVFVVIWCMNEVNVSATQFGVLTAIEMIVATLIYIPVARYSDRMERKPFVVVTYIFFTLFPILLFFSHSLTMLVVAFVVRGLKEFGEPTRKALIMDLSIKEAMARTVGAYYFIRDSLAAFAALIGGLLWQISPGVNLWTAAGFGVIGTLLLIAFDTVKKTSSPR